MSSDTDVSLSSYDEDQGSKLIQKAGGTICPHWNGRLKSRGSTKMSVHLLHMHVTAQGFVVGAMTLGMGCYLYEEFWAKPTS
ncbi:hypothetical protein FD754_014761 [Muntiacus muntjak]|uniref:HIG1 domain-containing protein n=1 Tax=Muntiacus muntjak TaxID=9888 RepID=A0A5N3VLA0_MUNMU|nr:hypothetical protein FD754_014761 [Muntiacus muntjak]